VLLNRCICGSGFSLGTELNRVPVLTCECGVVRTGLTMASEYYLSIYRSEYHDWRDPELGKVPYKERFLPDLQVAEIRLTRYAFKPGTKVLDVGSGNGAFVSAARDRGLKAYGVEMNPTMVDPDTTYVGELPDQHFPTRYFDYVTMHDVLEHVLDPIAYLKEIRRIIKPSGRLIVDFPQFWTEAGRHHWKPIEHIWFFTEEQMILLLKQCGFSVTSCTKPLPSRLVFDCTPSDPDPVSGPRILVLPGMGTSIGSRPSCKISVSRTNWVFRRLIFGTLMGDRAVSSTSRESPFSIPESILTCHKIPRSWRRLIIMPRAVSCLISMATTSTFQ
jgi:SAM-dependent methyltransferase